MEKDEKRQLIPLILLLIAIIIILTSFNIPKITNRTDVIGDILEINLDQCKIELIHELPFYMKFVDNGPSLTTIKCSKKIDKEIKSKWKPLPVPPDLEKAFPFGEQVEEKYRIPNIEKGYYFYIDRNSDDYKFQPPDGRYSVAVYDSENCLLYYYSMDTY